MDSRGRLCQRIISIRACALARGRDVFLVNGGGDLKINETPSPHYDRACSFAHVRYSRPVIARTKGCARYSGYSVFA